MMKILHAGRACLSVFLSLALFFPFSPPGNVQSYRDESAQISPPAEIQEQVEPPFRGLEKLSPDLRARFQANNTVEMNAMLMEAGGAAPLLVSALLRPGVDVQAYFTQSVLSREVDGVQWVTGDIQLKELGKLASLPGVLGVISMDTYETAEAPGLDELRFHQPIFNRKEARTLLEQAGPELLRQRVDERAAEAKARMLANDAKQIASLPAANHPGIDEASVIPTVRTIHDVDRALSNGYNGSGVVVGVVDTGVDFANPDLQGTQAVINSGPFMGWPFAYDTVSGALYALNTLNTIGPNNFWDKAGLTQFAHTQPVISPECSGEVCRGKLYLTTDAPAITFRWPNTSHSGKYYYTIHPDILLSMNAYTRGINYPESWLLPPPVIVSDENQAGVYDTIYVDTNYNYSLLEPSERATRSQPLSGADLTNDGTWDLSSGMLGWISDGVHHPPGVEVLYPELAKKAPPEAGRLLVFLSDQDGHGTNCASEIAGQGRITDPAAEGPTNPWYAGGKSVGGVGGAVVKSMAPSAKIAAFQNGFNLPFDAWTLAVLGMDGIKNSGDEVQILSNSWGDSETIEDGWDPVSRFAQHISYQTAPNVAVLVATGNGGPGYGTVTAPGGGSIIDVGASTAYGLVRGFEFVTPAQFLYGDIQPWSNRGPGGLGDLAPDISAVGAYGTGAIPLNQNLSDGQTAYDVFGGTSMSTPVAAGSLALIYQAYRQEFDAWPTWKQASDYLFSGAQDLSYDAFTQGAGNIRAGRSIDIVTGRAPAVSPMQWQVGQYHGALYPAFPAITYAGERNSQTFTITNPSETEVTLKVSDRIYQNVGDETFSFAYSNPPPEATRTLPIFLKDLTSLIEQYQPDMVRAQIVFPFATFDADEDYFADSWWSVDLYDWMDRNSNGRLWLDANRDDRVDEDEIDIDSASGLYEYNRFTYASPQGDALEASLGGASLERAHDGVFLGLRCIFCGHSTALQVRVTFYQEKDWPWLELSQPGPAIPADSIVELEAQVAVPADAQPGAYEGEIALMLDDEQVTVPVIVHVAANSETFRFGGQTALDTPYDNSHIFGGYNWNWRYESGDWRSFFFDIPQSASAPGKVMLIDTRWNTPKTDIDTWIMRPSKDSQSANFPGLYGPQGLQLAAGSANTFAGSGKFYWSTNTGGAREVVSEPMQDGLGMVTMHNVLNGGLQLAEGFSGKAYQLAVDPGEITLQASADKTAMPYLTGSKSITLSATDMMEEGLQIQAFGMTVPVVMKDQITGQSNPANICTSTWVYRKDLGGLKIDHGGLLDINTAAKSSNLDIDIYLYEDNGDGKWTCGMERIKAFSTNAGSEEKVHITFPQDGVYWLVVHGYSVRGLGKFDIQVRSLEGTNLTLQNMPLGPLQANRPAQFTLSYRGFYPAETPVDLEGLLMVGTPSNPAMLEIPVYVRPEILLYPEPQLTASPSWIIQSPSEFRLMFQNLGSRTESVTARIDLPPGLEYLPGTAAGPGVDPVYDADARALTWTGPAADGEQVVITFQAAALEGFPPEKADVTALVTGHVSEQEWQITTPVWLNLYRYLFPTIWR